ncbi:MAG TPA: glycosyltransferase family 1 protein [Sedimentisphaerales bacterium]|nr:glycosyltransferase family 1 protein [Sedimentisphaerales bacterium]
MRIGLNFHTVDGNISGVEYYSLGLIKGLLRIGTQHSFVVYTNQPGLLTEHVPASENLTIVEVKRLRSRMARIVWEHTHLPRLASKHRLDVLHCPGYICPLRKSSAPYVVTIHDTIAIDHPEWCKPTNALYFNLFMKGTVQRASRVISVSKSTAGDLERNFGLSDSKVRVVYPGIDEIFKVEKDASRCSQIREHYNLPERYVLFVGNIEPKKNVPALLAVHRRLREKGLPHKLVIVGKRSWCAGAELDQIHREAAAGNVIVTGYVDRADLPFVYAMADVFVFPSLYEGFGFPPLEAMACGTPVVSSNRGALAETLGDAACIIEPEDTEKIVEAVVSIISDSCLRKEHIEKGLQKSERFKWERTARETLSVYEEASAAQ